MTISKQALREEFRFMQVHYSDPADRARQVIYIAAEALLDELETKEEQRANWFQMAQKLGEDLDAAEKRNAEQREYYEGVIADGSKRIAELEKGHQEAAKQINSWRRLAKQNIAERGKDISELEAARQRIAELESKNGNLRTIAHDQNELAIRANLDSINDAVEMDSLYKHIAELEARTVTLPQHAPENLASVLDGYEKWLIATTFRDTWNACLAEVTRMNAAGIKVKG